MTTPPYLPYYSDEQAVTSFCYENYRAFHPTSAQVRTAGLIHLENPLIFTNLNYGHFIILKMRIVKQLLNLDSSPFNLLIPGIVVPQNHSDFCPG